METTFPQRLAYGKEAERAVCNVLDKQEVSYETTEKRSDWSPTFDQKYGDIWISAPWGNRIFKIDVKRSSVSFDSIDHFEGNYFILTEHEMKHFFVFPASSMKHYKATCIKNGNGYTTLSSGDAGIKFDLYKLVHLYKALFLNVWISDIMKPYDSRERED
jgi:hypothetical protein